VSLSSPAPNEALEATGHSVGFFPMCVSVPVARASAWAFGGRMISRVFHVGLITIKGNEVSDGESTQETTENVDRLAS
jgi:hypothetical protein